LPCASPVSDPCHVFLVIEDGDVTVGEIVAELVAHGIDADRAPVRAIAAWG
jgi:hypothetical protein